MERLLLKLVLEILKLLLQLVLWAVTGTWHRFGKKSAEAKPQPEQPKQPAAKKKKRKKPRASPPALSGQADSADPWALQYAPEQTEREPASEAEALAQAELRARRRKQAKGREKLQVAAVPRSLTSALRDRRTVRDALILGAALGPRDRRS